jgi:hypothetical protein
MWPVEIIAQVPKKQFLHLILMRQGVSDYKLQIICILLS